MVTRKKGEDYPFELTDSNNDKEKSTHQERRYERINIPSDIVTKANEGDATAELELGKFYYSAVILENNDTIAFEWIRRSAEQGNMEAQFRLGDIYALGFDTAKSLSESYKWYTKAAIQGYKKALIRIHNLYQEDIKMHCRGQLSSEEEECASDEFKKKNNIRELYEYRLEQNKNILNGAVEYYTKQYKHYQSVDENNPDVQLNLAFLYQHGYGAKKFIKWAFKYYALAAEQGDTDAQYNLGRLYQQHYRKKFNYRDAFKWYTKAAQGGSIAAQRCLAYFYLNGLATGIDYEMAIYWYTRAAEAGDSQSQVTLGLLYRKGDYIKQDLSLAVRWYTLAARQGNIVAQNCLSQLHQRGLLLDIPLEEDVLKYFTYDSMNNRLCLKLSMDVSKLVDLAEFKYIDKLSKNALIGDGPAMYEIGLRYYHGNKGFPQDTETGIKWIKNAANRDHIDAQFMMAKLYKEGESIKQDYYKSAIWYKTIAKQKDADARCQVGFMYKNGLGVRKDPLESSKWFTWSADQGNSEGQLQFGMLRLHGIGLRHDIEEATQFLIKSASQKNTLACYEIGKLYYNWQFYAKKNSYKGIGNIDTKENGSKEKSLPLLMFAAKHGVVDAYLFLKDIYKKGEYIQPDIFKNITYYILAINDDSTDVQYKLGLIYLFGYFVNCDYIKAYHFLKQASNKGHTGANMLFQTPMQYDSNINDYNKVIEMFKEITKRKIDDLSYNIGSMYEHGVKDNSDATHFNINYEKAQQWYFIASDKDDSRADYRLGIMSQYEIGVPKNIITAMYYYRNAMKKGNCDAMYRLACIYLEGYGIIQSFLEAFHLYRKASTMGHKKSIALLATLQTDTSFSVSDSNLPGVGPETPVERKNVISMLEKATEEGYTQLQYQLGVVYERDGDFSSAFKWFSLAADFGITDAYFRLSVLYEEGKGVEQNYKIAANMYEKATEKDHEDACFRLGQLYLYGNGAERDFLKAYHFFKKAAEMNHEMAERALNITLETKTHPNGSIKKNFFDPLSKDYQDSLTMCKYVGEHGDPEVQFKVGFAYEYSFADPYYNDAFKWYSMATNNSYTKAIYHLGLLYEKELGVSQDYQKAIQLYNRAYQLGSDDALHRLATVYHYGKGVEIDATKAIECYTLSAKLGNPKYQCTLGRLYEDGELVRKDLLKTLTWYTKAYLQGYDNIRLTLYDMYDNEPYENFFFKRLFRNLSSLSPESDNSNAKDEYKHLGDIDNRLGYMYLFGIGIEKDSKKALQYFTKEYSDITKTSITEFRFFECSHFNSSQKINILREFANDEGYIDQFKAEELYNLGLVFYDGKVESQYFNFDDKKKEYTLIDDYYLDYISKHIVIKKDYLTAFSYLKKAADKHYPKALLQLGFMYNCGHGVQKDINQGDKYFDLVTNDEIELLIEMTISTHTKTQSFSKAFVCYKQLEKILVDNSGLSGKYQKKINELVHAGLGLLYEYGDGVERDYQKAIDYYKKAADDTTLIGYLRLGVMYYYGKGVPVDYKKAWELFNNYGNSYGYSIPYVYEEENNLQTSNNNNDVDYSKRNRIYCTLTRNDIIGECFYYKGLMYKHGQGIRKNEKEAQDYFKSALNYECQRAANEIKED